MAQRNSVGLFENSNKGNSTQGNHLTVNNKYFTVLKSSRELF